jgi:hypothetical protein
MKMHEGSRFVYDGWVPIAAWDEESVRKSVRAIDEALAIFCLRGRAVFDWAPKYPAPSEPSSIAMFDDEHLQELEAVVESLDSLPETDRVAIYRSMAWLSQGLRLNEPMARFLFSILAIESLATYIEQKAAEDSPLVVLRKTRFTEAEQLACIDDTLSDWLQTDPRRAIERAYFDCVMSITRRLKTHLANVLRSDPEAYAFLFEKKVRGKTLYEMRHPIAHGSLDPLDEKQREQVQLRVWDAERIARQYIRSVLEAALGAKFPSASVSAGFFLDMQNVVVSSETMYRGPVHMAAVYG